MRRLGVLTALAILALAAPARASESKLPSTEIGGRIQAFLEVVKSRDEAGARRFITENYTPEALKRRPMEDRLQAYRELFEDLAGAELRSAASGAPGHTEVVVATAAGPWFRLGFDHEAESPQKIFGIMITEAPPIPIEIPEGKLSDEQIAATLDRIMKGLAEKDLFSGAVLVAHDGKPVFQGAWGLANKSFDVQNRIDTKFNLGSMNKMFTAMAVAQLAEAGKLSFEDKVGKYLPDFPNAEVRGKVTIHQLLTHTSGLGSYFESPRYQTTWPELRTLADYVPIVAGETLAFEPGAQMRYSNSGFVVAGLIIEKVSGEDYYDYVRKHIFEPAGMTNTDSYEVDQIVPNLAVGYTRAVRADNHREVSGPLRSNVLAHSAKGTAAGGGFSTVEDLLRFDQALRSHKLLGQKYTDILLQGKVPMGPDIQYAYGFGDRRMNSHRSVGHNGGAPGINADFKCYLDNGYTSVVLANYDRVAEMVARQIDEMVTR
jgi:CubicO group peptidase (beta-lactamase class C family)